MNIVFSDHSEIKIKQRKISKNIVIKTLISPDLIQLSYGGRQTAFKNFGKNFMAVTFVKENDDMVVITQHWVAKIKKK
ncbi:MAG: hypothetical protein US50_C0030G0015 [Candidatus Nomurabacteria bacterium GW2011_GWB1_37_5]|uniref:DUF4258 domain-containing protein n=1 Tax=Candidatus Nomurabacteria bacterium GW2011_GWB1_37_5 TaxID=1618742 RepID=A0A0G0GVA2_9BACT|nr:MAG: hypothetical protein US50_C0030G0015 [Candidatus Nomurabacteria bacterium GW2011_GWB1_37_5]